MLTNDVRAASSANAAAQAKLQYLMNKRIQTSIHVEFNKSQWDLLTKIYICKRVRRSLFSVDFDFHSW